MSAAHVSRALAQAALGAALTFAGTMHLTSARQEFRAQVPSWFPAQPDHVVVASGIAEVGLGAALLTVWRQPARARTAVTTAAFFAVIFPGNIAQFVERKDGFGLDTDVKRAARLLFQPVLVAWALAAGDVRRARRHR